VVLPWSVIASCTCRVEIVAQRETRLSRLILRALPQVAEVLASRAAWRAGWEGRNNLRFMPVRWARAQSRAYGTRASRTPGDLLQVTVECTTPNLLDVGPGGDVNRKG
jgi:hypothetical protein